MTPGFIASTLLVPAENVETIWPLVVNALKVEGIDDEPTQIAAAATIGVEVPSFLPINEYGSSDYFEKRYGPGTPIGQRLGNVMLGDGNRFHGRGLIQITGRANYRTYGILLGVDLLNDPKLALDPGVSSKILALYFSRHGIPEKAGAGNWEAVRRAVNGGLNGWTRFQSLVGLFQAGEPT